MERSESTATTLNIGALPLFTLPRHQPSPVPWPPAILQAPHQNFKKLSPSGSSPKQWSEYHSRLVTSSPTKHASSSWPVYLEGAALDTRAEKLQELRRASSRSKYMESRDIGEPLCSASMITHSHQHDSCEGLGRCSYLLYKLEPWWLSGIGHMNPWQPGLEAAIILAGATLVALLRELRHLAQKTYQYSRPQQIFPLAKHVRLRILKAQANRRPQASKWSLWQ